MHKLCEDQRVINEYKIVDEIEHSNELNEVSLVEIESEDSSNEAKNSKIKRLNPQELILFQIDDVDFSTQDFGSLLNKNWLSGDSIIAFFKSYFLKTNAIVLDFQKMNKFISIQTKTIKLAKV